MSIKFESSANVVIWCGNYCYTVIGTGKFEDIPQMKKIQKTLNNFGKSKIEKVYTGEANLLLRASVPGCAAAAIAAIKLI